MAVRAALRAAIPAAGVGCATHRDVVGAMMGRPQSLALTRRHQSTQLADTKPLAAEDLSDFHVERDGKT